MTGTIQVVLPTCLPHVQDESRLRTRLSLLERSVRSIIVQTYKQWRCSIVVSTAEGQEPPHELMLLVRELIANFGDERVDVRGIAARNLSQVLNNAVSCCDAMWIARMDDDDVSYPQRFEEQLAFVDDRLAAVGCAFEVIHDSRLLAVERPTHLAQLAAWRLHLRNDFAHGSMLIRPEEIVRVGGYDENLDRAQDYDLWLRLSGKIAACSAVLYQYYVTSSAPGASSPLQAKCAAMVQARAWAKRAAGDATAWEDILRMIGASAPIYECRAAMERVMLETQPTHAGLLALRRAETLLTMRSGSSPDPISLTELSTRGAVYLYGAGASVPHTLDAASKCNITIAGLLDDACAGTQRYGFGVVHPDAVGGGDTVIIASVARGEELWERAATLRARGVYVHRVAA